MNVLLTGSTGFLGKIFTKNLSTNLNLSKLSRTNSDFNISLEKNIPIFFKKYDYVIHTAGLAHLTSTNAEQLSQMELINVKGTENLLTGLSQSFLPDKFVFISSVSVYGITEGNMIDESHPLLAKDPYGLSKIKAEKLITEWCLLNNVSLTILRLPLIVGENPPGNLANLIKVIQKGYFVNIRNNKSKKSMVLGTDIVKFIFKAADVGGIYNLTDGEHPNFLSLTKVISNKYNRKYILSLPFFFFKILAKFGDLFKFFPFNSNTLTKVTSTLTFNDNKARIAFGWNPHSTLDFYAK
jgi:nucleoside-diphosphate-sugar epimerase